MGSLIVVVGGIAILDGLSDVPIYIGPLLVALADRQPTRTTLLFILGVSVTYLGMGVVGYVALDALDAALDAINARLWAFWHEPSFLEVCLQIAVGVVMLLLARRRAGRLPDDDDEAAPETLTPRRALMLGAGLALAGVPAAAPYFAAIAQILRAQLNLGASLSLLVFYNLLYILPLLCMLVLRLVFQEASEAIFAKVRTFINTWSRRLVTAGMLILGAVLVIDGLLWFFHESPLPY